MTGSLHSKTDRQGRQRWYGRWRKDGRQLNRFIGDKRVGKSKLGLTRPQAQRRLEAMIGEVVPAPVGGPLTVAELGERYVEAMRVRGRRESSIADVEGHLRVWLAPYFGDRDARSITTDDLEALVVDMQDGRKPGPRQKGDRRYGHACAPKTVRNVLGSLSAILNHAIRRRLGQPPLSVNPVALIWGDLPAAPKHEKRLQFLDSDESEALLAAAETPRERALYMTAFMTGARQAELLGLKWGDLDFPAGKVRIQRSYGVGGFGPTKSGKPRAVPMGDRLAGELDRLYKAQGEPGDDGLVFAGEDGRPMGRTSIWRDFKAACARARLDGRPFHSLRHTFGTRMAASGVAPRALQEFMGHSKLATTEIYLAYAPNEHEVELVNKAFGDDGVSTPLPSVS
jgi:integrase